MVEVPLPRTYFGRARLQTLRQENFWKLSSRSLRVISNPWRILLTRKDGSLSPIVSSQLNFLLCHSIQKQVKLQVSCPQCLMLHSRSFPGCLVQVPEEILRSCNCSKAAYCHASGSCDGYLCPPFGHQIRCGERRTCGSQGCRSSGLRSCQTSQEIRPCLDGLFLIQKGSK